MAIDRGHTTELTDSVMVGMINYWSWKPRVSKNIATSFPDHSWSHSQAILQNKVFEAKASSTQLVM